MNRYNLMLEDAWYSDGVEICFHVEGLYIKDTFLCIAYSKTLKCFREHLSAKCIIIIEPFRKYLFEQQDFEHAFSANGLSCEFDPGGPIGRGLYIGKRE
jgi:hypothetical protein